MMGVSQCAWLPVDVAPCRWLLHSFYTEWSMLIVMLM